MNRKPAAADGAARLRAALIAGASERYRCAGRFARYFARSKLGGDPVFTALLQHGLLGGCSRVLDLGCGQGLLAAWLLAARALHAATAAPGAAAPTVATGTASAAPAIMAAATAVAAWPEHWPAPPLLTSYTGIDINPCEIERARRAFAVPAGVSVRIVEGDIRAADLPRVDAVVVLDVLHYLDPAAQEGTISRARAALGAAGLLLLRVGDADAGLKFRLSTAVDRTVALARRGRWLSLHCRALRAWQELLAGNGFGVRALPMSAGTPFANTLLVAQVP